MAKPIVDATWCTTKTNTTEPSADQRLHGWKPNETPTSDVLNFYQNTVGALLEYLDEQDLEAPVTVRSPSEATYTPLLAGLDPSALVRRATIDHNGFRMGRVSDFREEWQTTGTTEPQGWTFESANGGTRTYIDPTADNPYRMVQLDVAETPEGLSKLYSLPLTYHATTRTLVAEWDVRTGAAIQGEGDMKYTCRIEFSHAAAWDRYVGFQLCPEINPNIGYAVEGTASVLVYSDVLIEANTTYRLRIELCGSENHDGNNTLARWFINGAFINQANFGSPDDDVVRIAHQIVNGADNPNDPYRVYVGPNRASWNHGNDNDAV